MLVSNQNINNSVNVPITVHNLFITFNTSFKNILNYTSYLSSIYQQRILLSLHKNIISKFNENNHPITFQSIQLHLAYHASIIFIPLPSKTITKQLQTTNQPSSNAIQQPTIFSPFQSQSNKNYIQSKQHLMKITSNQNNIK